MWVNWKTKFQLPHLSDWNLLLQRQGVEVTSPNIPAWYVDTSQYHYCLFLGVALGVSPFLLLYNLILQQRPDGVSKSTIKKGTITMAKNAHLTYDDRLTIQSSIADHLSYKSFGSV